MEQAGDALAGVAQIFRRADAVPAGAVSAIGKDSYADSTKPSAVAVDGNCAAGVVDLQNAVVEENASTHQQASQSSDYDRSRGGDEGARGRYGDQSSQHAIACHGDVGLTENEVPEDHGSRGSGNASKIRVDRNRSDAQVGRTQG